MPSWPYPGVSSWPLSLDLLWACLVCLSQQPCKPSLTTFVISVTGRSVVILTPPTLPHIPQSWVDPSSPLPTTSCYFYLTVSFLSLFLIYSVLPWLILKLSLPHRWSFTTILVTWSLGCFVVPWCTKDLLQLVIKTMLLLVVWVLLICNCLLWALQKNILPFF